MAMNEEGFVKINRSEFNDIFFNEKRKFTRFEAWIDLLQLASYKDGHSVMVNNKMFTLNKGEIIASFRFLEKRWNWSNNKIKNYFLLLEKATWMRREMRQGQTIVIICKTGYYGEAKKEKATPLVPKKRRECDADATLKRRECDETKKEKKVRKKESKKEYMEMFNQFRLIYPGSKRGNETEFNDLLKWHPDWEKIVPDLKRRLLKQISDRELMKQADMFIPPWKMLKTYLHNRSWEEEYTIIPRESNSTNQSTQYSNRNLYQNPQLLKIR